MTIFSGKFFTFAGHENWVSYLNSQGAQYHRIESHLVQQKSPYQLPNCRKTAFQISVEGCVLFFNEEEYQGANVLNISNSLMALNGFSSLSVIFICPTGLWGHMVE